MRAAPRGRGFGGSRGGFGDSRGGSRGGFGGSRGGFRGGRGGGQRRDAGPPSTVVQIGKVEKIVEGKIICECTHRDVPILRRKVYYQNKNELGNIEDVFGTTANVGFVIELPESIKADSFKEGDLIYGDQFNMLTKDRFLEGDKKKSFRPKYPNQQGKLKIR